MVRELPRNGGRPAPAGADCQKRGSEPRPGDRSAGGPGRALVLSRPRRIGQCKLGLSGHFPADAAPPALQHGGEHLRRLSGGLLCHALRARAPQKRKPGSGNRHLLRALRPGHAPGSGRAPPLADTGDGSRSAPVSAPDRLGVVPGPQYHRRLLNEFPILLVRRTCSENENGRAGDGVDGSRGGNRSGAGTAVCIFRKLKRNCHPRVIARLASSFVRGNQCVHSPPL